MSTGMNSALFHGATSVLLQGQGPGELVEAITRHRVSLLVGVPATVQSLVDHPGIEEADLSSLECCFVGAAPTPGVVRKKFNRLTPTRLLEGYGLTEAVTAQSANPAHGESKWGSIGLPFPDVEFKIVDLETGSRELAPEKAGELVIKSPCLMKGYHNRPRDTAKALRDGWLFTGDVAWVDRDGYFYVIDRKKDMVTTGVYKAYPAEVEAVINSHPKVKESAVVGLFDDFRGHSLKAFVVLAPGETMTGREVADFLKANLSAHKVPRVIEFRDELPRSAAGKILRKDLES
jgi:long-chain acyl-CoA synthetase